MTRNGKSRAYLGSLVTAAGGTVEDRFEGRTIRLVYSSPDGAFHYEVPEDDEVCEAYWFAWKAFHPDTGIWNVPGSESP